VVSVTNQELGKEEFHDGADVSSLRFRPVEPNDTRDFDAPGGLVADGDALDLQAEFVRIRNDIAAQYVLGFEPLPSATGRLHKLKIEVTAKDAKVRHRLAYETKTPR
jgi:hypothetical protein